MKFLLTIGYIFFSWGGREGGMEVGEGEGGVGRGSGVRGGREGGGSREGRHGADHFALLGV